ncbi:MAG: Bax inhibitor-1/YccA family protein [Lentisphaeria bacterium]|nr:Bax inhibitor-1/YccA family protein [Lentisphaeria bacterium]
MYDDNNSFSAERASSALSACLVNVYWWMTFALLVSGVAAWAVGTSPELSKKLVTSPGLCLVLFLVEIVLVIGITAGIRKLSAATATALFIAYSLINGVTMSFIFLAYTQASIVSAFAVTAGTFGVMAVYGSVTKRDLTGLGSLFLMALIGIIIASIVNIFWMNDTFGLIISCVGVIVFVGLTAYDAQKVKKMFLESGMESSEVVRKIAILGALSLYLDFINLFLFILRIFGRRR